MPDLARLCTLYALLCTCIHVHRSHANNARFETDEEGDSEVVTLCPAIKDALVFAAAPGHGHATPLALAGKPPARCLVIAAGSSGCAGHGCIGLGSCVDAPAWETAPSPGGHGQMVRTAQGAVCLDFNAGAMRLQAYDCLNGTTHLNQHWAVDASATGNSSSSSGDVVFGSLCTAPWCHLPHGGFICLAQPTPPPAPPGPPRCVVPTDAWLEPIFHLVPKQLNSSHCADAASVIFLDGVWHWWLGCDGCALHSLRSHSPTHTNPTCRWLSAAVGGAISSAQAPPLSSTGLSPSRCW